MESKYSVYMTDIIPKIGTLQRAVSSYVDKSDPIHCDTLPEMPSGEISFIVTNYLRLRGIMRYMIELYKRSENVPDLEESLDREYANFTDIYKKVVERDNLIKKDYHKYWDTQIDLL